MLWIYWLFTLVITSLTGSCGCLPLPSITREHPITYHLAQEKIKIQILKYNFYWMPVIFTSLYSRKIINQTIISQGPSVFPVFLILTVKPFLVTNESLYCYQVFSPLEGSVTILDSSVPCSFLSVISPFYLVSLHLASACLA